MTARSQLAGVTAAAAFFALFCALPAHADATASNTREVTLAEYRQHLVELNDLVEACAKARDTRSCDPALAGQDDRVPLGNTEGRLVRYDWLRALLVTAQKTDEAAPAKTPQGKSEEKSPAKKSSDKNESGSDEGEEAADGEYTRPPKPATSQLLRDAQTRLSEQIAQADTLAAGTVTAATADHAQDHIQVREVMKQVLAGRDFRNLESHTARDTFMEKLGDWLNQLWASFAKLQVHVAWVGRAIVWGFILIVCVGLVWGLMQFERRWRIRLIPESDGTAAGAASARDWQLWLEDARRSAAEGLWREAIHFVYWAAISRLESRRLWPADRARTPREYLALVAAEDPRRAGLTALTGSFERVWYGGRAAGEGDYQRAEQLADGLIFESYPSRKNKDAARVGHPELMDQSGGGQ
ncbi:MAG: DUF4129 domain-containing protein [Terracidiphilus sp.]